MHHTTRNARNAIHPTHLAVIAAVAALLVSATAMAQPKAPKKIDTRSTKAEVFRYQHTPGSTNAYTTKMIQKLKMDPSEGSPMPPVSSSSTIDTTMGWTTESVKPDGSATVNIKYEDLKMSIEQNGVKIPKEQLKPLQDMLNGTTSKSVLTSRGEPKVVETSGKQGSGQLGESMKAAMVGTTPIFPEKGLKPGGTWNQKIPMKLAQGGLKISLDFKVTYTFMGYTTLKDTRVAVFKTSVESALNETPSGLGGAKLTMTGGGKGGGYLYFDNVKGRLVKSELEMDQNTVMEIDAGQGPSSLKMVQKTVTLMTLK